jgi:hypothetical protein
VADLRSGFVLAGLSLAIWALVRTAAAGTPAAGLGWVLFGAGTAAVVLVSRRLDAASGDVHSVSAGLDSAKFRQDFPQDA